MSTLSFSGYRYYVQFQDDYSGFRVIYFIKQKNEVFRFFRIYVARMNIETGQRISTLRSDNGGEYVSNDFKAYLEEKGIRHETCAPHTPEQDGVSERSNRTIMESSLSSLLDLDLPLDLWAEATSCSVYVQNRIHGRTTTTTPYQAWFSHHRKPDVSHFHIFGIFAYVHVPKTLRRKLDAKSTLLRFVGYSETQKAWRFFDRTTHRIPISRDAIFCERFPPDENGAPALPLSIEHPHPLISSISRPFIASDISNHLLPLPRQFLPCSSVVQLPEAIPSSLDDLSSSSDLQVPCSPIIQQPFYPNEVVDNQLSSSSSPASLDDSPEEDFYGFEPVARPSNRIRTPKHTVSLFAVPTVSSDFAISDINTIDHCNSFSYQAAISGSDSAFWFTAM
jgi:hypothetical protein